MNYRSQAAGFTDVVVTTPVSNSDSAVQALVTGSTFQPDANARYLVEVIGSSYSGANTNGLRWRIGDDATTNVSSFAFRGTSRDSTVGTGVAVFTGTGSPTTAVLGLANATAAPGAPFEGDAFVETGSNPPAVGVYFYPETNGNAVTIYQMVLSYKRIA